MRFPLLCLLALMTHLGAETLPPLKDGQVPQNLDELWAGFDPRKEPLEVEVTKEWEVDGIVCRAIRYRIGIFKGQPATMAAFYAFGAIGAVGVIAGGVGMVGHIDVCDNVFVTGMTMVTRSITEPGSYSSGTAMQPASEWRKSAARIRQLDEMARRLQQLEKRLAAVTSDPQTSSEA